MPGVSTDERNSSRSPLPLSAPHTVNSKLGFGSDECNTPRAVFYFSNTLLKRSRTPLKHPTEALRATLALFIVSCLALAAACSGRPGGGGPGGTSGGAVRLQGAGATFPNPLYQKWVSEYGKAHPEVKIDYQSIGSGGGIKQ